MNYISGKHALNIPTEKTFCPDWHTEDYDWNEIDYRESDYSIFGDYGIVRDVLFYKYTGARNVAGTVRAILDLCESGETRWLRGFRHDFFNDDNERDNLFSKVMLLRSSEHWMEIDELFEKEYRLLWVNYKDRRNLI